MLGTGVCGSRFRKGGSSEGFVAFVVVNLQPELRLVSQGWATSSRAPAASGRFQLTLHFACFNLNPIILVSSMQLRKRRPKLQVTWEIGEIKKLTDIPSRCRFVSRQVSWATVAVIGVCRLFLGPQTKHNVVASTSLGVRPVDLSKSPSHGNMGWKPDGSGMGRAFSKLDE